MEPTQGNLTDVSGLLTDKDMRDCIAACTESAQACNSLISYCLQSEGRHAEAAHVSVVMDCAEICQITASFLGRSSSLRPELTELCALACDRCAESCEESRDDQAMAECARRCRRCAELCRAIA